MERRIPATYNRNNRRVVTTQWLYDLEYCGHTKSRKLPSARTRFYKYSRTEWIEVSLHSQDADGRNAGSEQSWRRWKTAMQKLLSSEWGISETRTHFRIQKSEVIL